MAKSLARLVGGLSVYGLFLSLALTVIGCASEPTFGRVYGSLEIPDCDEDKAQDRTCSEDVPRDQCEAFDLEVTFFALQFYPDNSAKLRFQAGGSDFALTDGLLFDIRDTADSGSSRCSINGWSRRKYSLGSGALRAVPRLDPKLRTPGKHYIRRIWD